MDNLELYKQCVNQIFTCLDNLDTNLENSDNTNAINNLREYKDLAISFAKLLAPDGNSEVPADSKEVSA